MKEQSHKSEMSAAVRGDFERLRARRSEAPAAEGHEEAPEPVRQAAVAPVPVTEPVPVAEPAPQIDRPGSLPPAAAAVPEEPSSPGADPQAEPVRRSWLDRLRGRA